MNKEEWKKIFHQSLTLFVSLALALLLFFVIWRFNDIKGTLHWLTGVLIPFVYGGVLAYLLKPPCNFLEKKIEALLPQKRKKLANSLAVLATLILALLIVYLLFIMVIPELARSIMTLANTVPQSIEQFTAWLNTELEGSEVLQGYVNTALTDIESRLQGWAQTDLIPMLQGIMGGFATTVGSVMTLLSNLVIGIIVCIYLLLGRKTFVRQGRAVLYAVMKPQSADKVLDEITFIDKIFVGFFAGKILDSVIVGVICYVFCVILSFMMDFPNALLISVIIGVTNMIPYFGPFIGTIPTALLILIDSPLACFIFVVFIIILQQFDGNILGPMLLADSVGLSSFWVLFSITLFQGLFGFVGLLIGVPVFAVIYDLIKRAVVRGLAAHGKSEELYRVPEPPKEAEKPRRMRRKKSGGEGD